MEAVKGGAGREDAHEAIKQHAVAAVKDLRKGKSKENDLIARLAKDKRIGMKIRSLQALVKEGEARLGASSEQVDHFVKRAHSWGERHPDAKSYSPPQIL